MTKRILKAFLPLLLAVFSLACFAGFEAAPPTEAGAPTAESQTRPPTAAPVVFPSPAPPTSTACVVTAESLNVRTAPEGFEASRVLAWLRAGEVVTIIESRGAWLFIRAGNVEGWINSKFCEGK